MTAARESLLAAAAASDGEGGRAGPMRAAAPVPPKRARAAGAPVPPVIVRPDRTISAPRCADPGAKRRARP